MRFVFLAVFVSQPDRPDELNRIQSSGGRVIYWEGPRVLGVLAMSRAIGKTIKIEITTTLFRHGAH